MGNAVGLRDQMLRLYARANAGAPGKVRPTFTFSAQWWGRLDVGSSTERGAQDKLQLRYDARAEFADECVVPPNGVLKDQDGVMWWIRGITAVRTNRAILVGLDRIDEEQAKTFTVYEGKSTLDGAHLIDPATPLVELVSNTGALLTTNTGRQLIAAGQS
jgi:hypothetical protein